MQGPAGQRAGRRTRALGRADRRTARKAGDGTVLRDLAPVVLLGRLRLLPTEPIRCPGGGPSWSPWWVTASKDHHHRPSRPFQTRERSDRPDAIDTYRIAAVDQLRAYAEILSVRCGSYSRQPKCRRRRADATDVLIDTSGEVKTIRTSSPI